MYRRLLELAVDGDPVPVPHFGVALTVAQFHSLAERCRACGIQFVIEPHLRFKGVLEFEGAERKGVGVHAECRV